METKASHTPGPWCVGHTRKSSISTYAIHETPVHVGERSSYGNEIAIVHTGGDGATRNDVANVEANARLIAAAPELLAACKAAMRIKDLWLRPVSPPDEQGDEEGYALYLMERAFSDAIAKAT